MRKKEKAAVDIATIGSGVEKQIREAAINLSDKEYITAVERKQGQIEALLLHGEASAIPTAQLVVLAGLRSQRDLRLAIERERRNGALILSTVRGRGGYYLPATDPDEARAEIKAFVRTVKSRAINSLAILASANAALGVLPGQEVIE